MTKLARSLPCAAAAILAACGGSGTGTSTRTNESIITTFGPVAKVRGYLGMASAVTATFTSSDGGVASQFAVTSALDQLPAGWSSSAQSFSCAQVSTGSGCVLHLTYTPTVTAAGALALAFRYVTDDGTAKSGSASISYTATRPSLMVLAGSVGGPGNLDGTGTGARFGFPASVAADALGNLYVADHGNSTIRKIAAGAVVTTLAGSGASVWADGIGRSASFIAPGALTVDPAGNIYVVDLDAIRVVSPTGSVSTLVAGNYVGQGYAGVPHNLPGRPSGILISPSGTLYVSTVSAPPAPQTTVASVALDGSVQVLAGDHGEFSGGLGPLISDPLGTLYTLETGVGIVSISPVGAVATVDPEPSNASAGLALNVAGAFFVADPSLNSIYQYSPSHVYSKFAGCDVAGCIGGWADGGPSSSMPFTDGGGALMNQPTGLAFDPGGNLIVADSGNSAIRLINPGGGVTTLAGAGLHRGYTDGIGIDARFDMAMGADGPAHMTCFVVCDDWGGGPSGAVADGMNNVYVADTGYSLIRLVTPAGSVTTVPYKADTSGADCCANYGAICCAFAGGIGIDHDGALYVTVVLGDVQEFFRPSAVLKIVPNGTAVLVKDSTGHAVLSQRGGNGFGPVAVDSNGAVYVGAGTELLRITAAGSSSVWAGTETAGAADGAGAKASFGSIAGVAVASSGEVYVADAGNQTIRRVTTSAVVSTVAGRAGEPGSADGVAGSARFNGPGALSFDSNGTLYIADTVNRTVRRLWSDGTVDTVIGTPGLVGTTAGFLPATLDQPQGIAIRSDGQLAITVDSGVLATVDL